MTIPCPAPSISTNSTTASHWPATRQCLAAFALAGWATGALAQAAGGLIAAPGTPAPPTAAGAAQLEAQYRSCPGGHYTGPRPGRTRYTQDPFMWAVTPAFAAKFCFPKEFISEELKGAEAVAVKRDESKDEFICGWGNNREVCGPSWRHWRIELYVPTGVLPEPRHRFYVANALPSGMLLSESSASFQKSRMVPRRQGLQPPFNSDQIGGIFGITTDQVVWHSSYSSLTQQQYFDKLMGEYDYLAVSQQIGGMSRPYGKVAPEKFMIVVHKPDHDGVFSQQAVAEAPVKIMLPRKLIEHMRAEDERAKADFMRDVRRALAPSLPNAATPTKSN